MTLVYTKGNTSEKFTGRLESKCWMLRSTASRLILRRPSCPKVRSPPCSTYQPRRNRAGRNQRRISSWGFKFCKFEAESSCPSAYRPFVARNGHSPDVSLSRVPAPGRLFHRSSPIASYGSGAKRVNFGPFVMWGVAVKQVCDNHRGRHHGPAIVHWLGNRCVGGKDFDG